jgi:hypothetical protein
VLKPLNSLDALYLRVGLTQQKMVSTICQTISEQSYVLRDFDHLWRNGLTGFYKQTPWLGWPAWMRSKKTKPKIFCHFRGGGMSTRGRA